MPEAPGGIRVAVNVMRARLTVIGFNIAVVTFQINQLGKLPGGTTQVPGLERTVHLGVDFALFAAFGLAFMALVVFIVSNAMDPVGICDHWSLVAGDLLMYQSLAQTISGFFVPFLGVADAAVVQSPDSGVHAFRWMLLIVGGGAWFLAAYVGPAVSLYRSPFGRPATLSLAAGYAALFLALATVSAQVGDARSAGSGGERSVTKSVLVELFQPARW
jgi:hypothetical protein